MAKREVVTNLQILKKSRKPLRSGDVFVLQVIKDEFLFGRVIRTDAKLVSMRDVILIYVYNTRASCRLPIPELSPDQLLIPPQFINKLPWSRGYFETIANTPLSSKDLLPMHCFERSAILDPTRVRYFDEYDNQLDKRYEPCGTSGLGSFRTIDDEVSSALGIPLAPD